MTDFTRVTVVGAARRAEIVVASDEPYAGLVPRFLEILGEAADTPHPLTLVRVTGEELDLARDSEAQAVLDGEVLRLVRAADAPPPPEVSDVTDAVSDELSSRGGLWSERARQSVGGAAILAAFLLIGLMVPPLLNASAACTAVLATAAVLAVGAAAAGRSGFRWPASAATAASIGLAVPLGLTTAAVLPHASGALAASVATLWGWVAVGLGFGAGLRIRPLVTAAVLGAALATVASALFALSVVDRGVWGLVAVLATLSCGLLPAWAMSASGLTGLDDAVSNGEPAPRGRLVLSLRDAYSTLDWTVGAVALAIGASATALVASANPWSVALGWAVVIVTALRTRAFPGLLQGVFLWAGVVVATVSGVAAHLSGWPGIGALTALAILAAVLAGLRPAPHVRARLRGYGNVAEAIAVIVMLPLLIGSFGLYTQLLGTF